MGFKVKLFARSTKRGDRRRRLSGKREEEGG
jgi:hypothetical protein